MGRPKHVTAWRAVPRDATHDTISWATAAEATGVRTSRDGGSRSSIPSFPVTSLRITLDTPSSMCVSCLPDEQRPTAPRHDHSPPHAACRDSASRRTAPPRGAVTHRTTLTGRVQEAGSLMPGWGEATSDTSERKPLACSRGPATARHHPRTPPAGLVTRRGPRGCQHLAAIPRCRHTGRHPSGD